VSLAQWIGLAFLAVFIMALYRSKRQAQPDVLARLRPIPFFDQLTDAMARAAESGRALHVSLGTGGIASDLAADSLAALSVLEAIARRSGTFDRAPIVTLADAALIPIALDMMQEPAHKQVGLQPAPDVRWLTSSPPAYAAGVMEVLGGSEVMSSVMVGAYGDEYLLMGEAANRLNRRQLAGASDPTVLPFVWATAEGMLMGEELYAAGAYLSGRAWHVHSLLAQDCVRWMIVLAILVLVGFNSFF